MGGARANTLFSIDSHWYAVVRAYAIEPNALGNAVTINPEILNPNVPNNGPIGIAASDNLGLDLRISSCYNKVILFPDKMSGIIGTFERERSES